MNSINQPAAAPTPIKSAVSGNVAAGKETVSGNTLPHPSEAAKVQRQDLKAMQENVEAAVADMNKFIQSTQRDLHFSYDRDAGATVVKVLDRSTQQVIRQIPDETFLKLARSTDSEGSLHFFSAQA
jgi:flagellar protein FlaG